MSALLQLRIYTSLILSICTASLIAGSTDTKIVEALNAHNYVQLNSIIKNSLGNKINLRELKNLAEKNNALPFARAINATIRLNPEKAIGVSTKSFLQAALFIETELPLLVQKKKYYFSRSMTGLDLTIQYDPNTGNTFLHPSKLRGLFIGEGAKKTVHKAILYDAYKPEIIASAYQEHLSSDEYEITKLLIDAPGIFKIYGFGKTSSSSKRETGIYSRLYNPGALQTAFENHVKLSLHEKAQAALSLIQGLHSMHSRKIVHCDLGARNYLIDIPKGKKGKRKVEAAIADLGRATYARELSHAKVQGNTTYTAPEALYVSKMKNKKYFASDVYAIGLVLYWLYYDKKAPWADFSYVKDTTRYLDERYQDLVHQINRYTHSRRVSLASKAAKGKISAKDRFEFMILRMVNPNPDKRGTASELLAEMQEIAKRL